ncbi:phenylacetate--CoA ligase family protein [Williamsia deligens]|uniref:Phenylacetate-coenzyme A ligase PaaK, adenylate-forming domain family n=1 Tax=Williamsia deligens TaxID=321325 RepID=A0ABW3G7W3_9NOCA|nr:hypothetical protein [Williamsia deligens]MCP2192545.1 Phenylacetate-coenzyme A ligase PaaK, adenylate-forming domain family [Williamsia deligens]
MADRDVTPSDADVERSARWLDRDIRRAARAAPSEIDERVHRRLGHLVTHARNHSPLFGELYAAVPPEPRVDDLPITTKPWLMERYDLWATDRRVTSAAVDDYVARADPGSRDFLGDYMYSESSGTSGATGRFVTERSALKVLHALRSRLPRPSATTLLRVARKRGRSAAIINDRGHHMGAVYYRRADGGARAGRILVPVTDPISVIEAALEDCDPASISSYGSVLAQLAERQIAGHLNVDPAVLIPFSETVTDPTRRRLLTAWPNATVAEQYVANECMFISARCSHGAHHLNADWVILEPVDVAGRPVPQGTTSHSVLLTTLFRRVQPIIRYDLGDRVRFHEHQCPCGSRLPAFDVLGRTGHLISLQTQGGQVSISPTVLTVALDDLEDVVTSQLAIDSDDHVTVRLTARHGADAEAVGAHAAGCLWAVFRDAGAPSVSVRALVEDPVRGPGGKIPRTIDHRPT